MSRSGIIRKALGPLRARLQKFISDGQTLLQQPDLPSDTQGCHDCVDDIVTIQNKLQSIVASVNEKDKLWRDLIFDLDQDELGAEEAIYAKFALDEQEGYLNTIEVAKELICDLDKRKTKVMRSLEKAPIVSNGSRSTDAAASSKMSIKLPKITLPGFDGDPLEWPKFWAIFKANIHDRNLEATEKFAYLCGQLSGSALKCIEGLSFNDTNYENAITILKERYEKSQTQLVGILYSQLKRLPMSSSTKVSDLMSTFDSCETIFRQLTDSGESIQENRSLVLELLSKFPVSVVKDLVERYNVGPDSTLSELREGIRTCIRCSETLEGFLANLDPFSSKCDSKVVKATSHIPAKVSDYVPTSAFSAPAQREMYRQIPKSPDKQKPQNPCYFCSALHFNSQCPKFRTADERRQRLREQKRCTECLGSGHSESNCQLPKAKLRCFFCKSTGEHASPMCPKEFSSSRPDHSTTANANVPQVSSSSLLNANEQAFLLTAVASIHNEDGSRNCSVRLLFDSGSHRTYVTKDVAQLLNLPALDCENLHVAVFGADCPLSVESKNVRFNITLRNGATRLIDAHTTPVITSCPIHPAKLREPDTSFLASQGFILADDSAGGPIDVLVGSDYFWDFLENYQTLKSPSGLYMIPSTLGVLVGGRYIDCTVDTSSESVLLCLTESFSPNTLELNQGMSKSYLQPKSPITEDFWNLETVGIRENPVAGDDDDVAMEKFNDTVVFSKGRYHVRWPWKQDPSLLPSNYELAVGRLKSLTKRLNESDSKILQAYQDVLCDQLQRKIIEVVPPNEVRSSENPVHYLAHHPVLKPGSATTKVRIVYDASAKTRRNSLSLNECLFRGPVILPNLCAMLLRFRLYPIAIITDIEKAFLQICLQKTERDVTRFVWFADSTKLVTDNNLITYRFCRVPFGIISSPFLLSASIQYHLRTVQDWVAERIQSNIYVDNVMTGVETTAAGLEFCSRAQDIFSAASMNLRQWRSNSEEVNKHTNATGGNSGPIVKVLGLEWDSAKDSLRLGTKFNDVIPTKRSVLQFIASVFDPLGLFQPVLLLAKLFLQKLWDSTVSWDQVLSEEHTRVWIEIRNKVVGLADIEIPRCVFPLPVTEMSIVTFCDASATSYATTVYLRMRRGDQWDAYLAFSKSRLAPKCREKKPISLPRLELLGALIGTRASGFVRQSLPDDFKDVHVCLFTDSTCVLHWLRSKKICFIRVCGK